MNSPAILITSSKRIAEEVQAEIDLQLSTLPTADSAGITQWGPIPLYPYAPIPPYPYTLSLNHEALTITLALPPHPAGPAWRDSHDHTPPYIHPAGPAWRDSHTRLSHGHNPPYIHPAGPAWRDFGEILLVDTDDELVHWGDFVCSEHTQIMHKNPRLGLGSVLGIGLRC